ncbi:MAG: ABC transporter permease [Phycisphaerae bacterium]|nr:ABC transporter permease [Phycisphaerae bacterium]
MGPFIVRRLIQAVLTIFGVMLLTFLLFRVGAGDIAAAHIGEKSTEQDRMDWLRRHGYDLPTIVNVHERLVVRDKSDLNGRPIEAEDAGASLAADRLALVPAKDTTRMLVGRYVWLWRTARDDDVGNLTEGRPLTDAGEGTLVFKLADGTDLSVDPTGVKTVGELLDRINNHPDNRDRLEASITSWRLGRLTHSQFFDHLVNSVTFQAESLATEQKLTTIIATRAPRSLALTVPALALGWIVAMVTACFVAYYRGTLADRLGVLLSVLGMCIPFLAFMIYGQWLMFHIAPVRAYGLWYRSNIYVPILIMVIAGLGPSVRFYRTVILDEVNRDYVRTARAKGLPLGGILFKHVLKNCMLPILTQLIVSIPFLILGSLLVEKYFGIPGLGDLMLSSINGRDEPVLNALVFLTAVIYTVGLLITDISYAVFDPRIRLR